MSPLMRLIWWVQGSFAALLPCFRLDARAPNPYTLHPTPYTLHPPLPRFRLDARAASLQVVPWPGRELPAQPIARVLQVVCPPGPLPAE